MKNIQSFADKAAISLSFLCTLHCLALPLALALLPAATAFNLEDEVFHIWLLIAVIPTSLIALAMGCKKHSDYKVLLIGITGLSLLILAAVLGHDFLGENGEKWFTILGAVIIVIGHILNHRLCQRSLCECHS
jgi:hypothetical protein